MKTINSACVRILGRGREHAYAGARPVAGNIVTYALLVNIGVVEGSCRKRPTYVSRRPAGPARFCGGLFGTQGVLGLLQSLLFTLPVFAHLTLLSS